MSSVTISSMRMKSDSSSTHSDLTVNYCMGKKGLKAS